MRAISTTKKIGGSIMIRIPKDVAEAEGIKPGDLVTFNIIRRIK